MKHMLVLSTALILAGTLPAVPANAEEENQTSATTEDPESSLPRVVALKEIEITASASICGQAGRHRSAGAANSASSSIFKTSPTTTTKGELESPIQTMNSIRSPATR